MRKKTGDKPYWEMTSEELREATKEFDKEFVADDAQPLTPHLQGRWQRAKAKGSRKEEDSSPQTIAVRLEKTLLDRCTALARKKRVSRDVLIARGLKALLAAEGEE